MSDFRKPSAYKSVNSSSFTAIREKEIQEYTENDRDTGNIAWLVQNLKTLFVKNSQN